MDEDTHLNLESVWHSLSLDNIYQTVNTSIKGLSDVEATKRLKANGANLIKHHNQKSVWQMIRDQITDLMIIVLIIAASLAFVLDGIYLHRVSIEGVVILVIVLINVVISVIQEIKANDALKALSKIGAPTAKVLRQGEISIIKSSEVVVGDIVYLEDGCIVPADIRLIETNNLAIQEATLTGESMPVDKFDDQPIAPNAILPERLNMAYSSCIVLRGNGYGVVVATGQNTQIGKIAQEIEHTPEEATPLKQKLNRLAKLLSLVGAIVCVIIIGVGLAYDINQWNQVLYVAIALGVSVIPEGLPAVATIIMALGVVKMSKANMLVRSLPAVESLGNVSVICTDKTGTLTKNQIIVTAIAHYGDIQQNNVNDPNHLDSHYTPLIYASVLCNNATLDPDHVQQVLGDGTEGALLALDHDFLRLRQTYPKIYEQPFDSDRKLMSTIHKINNINTVYTKGAVEELLKRCNSVCYQDQILVMTDETKTKIMTMANTMMQQGLRVLSFASKKISEIPNQHNINIEYDLSFLGLVGMMDAVREEVKPVILECQKAQIKTVMITGDHQITAVAVAKQLHIFQDNNIVVNGQDLSTMTDTQLQTACAQATVFARVSPKDKLRIVKTYQASGEIVAMTGDGVNDAPALKIANVGVSMGKSGTDVAKAAADLLLLDDNFTTIAKAIREGRRIYQNILKLVMFLVAGNIAEIIVLTLAILLNWTAPLTAVQILIVNLVTDTIPCIAIGLEPATDFIMLLKPNKKHFLLDKYALWNVFGYGFLIALLTLSAFSVGIFALDDTAQAITLSFVVLAISQLFFVFNLRSRTLSAFSPHQPRNILLFFTVMISLLLILIFVLVPVINAALNLCWISWWMWLLALGFAVVPIFVGEIQKIFMRNYHLTS